MPMMEISIVPLGTKSASLSGFVAAAQRVLIKEKGAKKITAMGPIVEASSINKLLAIARKMHTAVVRCGAPPQAYAYLSRTIRGFITRQQVLDLMNKSGLTKLSFHNLCGGIVCCYRGIKTAHE